MKDKARASLAACKALAAQRTADSAMSRLYYALFQAGVHSLASKGKSPSQFAATARDGKWTHEILRNNASLCRNRRGDRALFELAFGLRVTADYETVAVDREQFEQLIPRVEEFLQEVSA